MEHKKKLMLALKKARGTLDHVFEAVEKDTYCIDILQQLNAAMGLLRGASARIVENHLKTCGHKHMSAKSPRVREKFVAELLNALEISSRK